MRKIQLTDLLNMDMGEVSEWLIENADKYQLIQKPEYIDHIEDIDVVGEEILCWDGCDWHIDYVEIEVEYGTHYMANGTETEAWMPLPKMDE